MSSPLQEYLLERTRTQGPLPFAAFMQLALYHPQHGYYTSGRARTDWSGHFLTSPEVDPAFGGLWARAFEQIWDAAGRPASFDVIELGPGEGGFAAAVLAAVSPPFADTLRLHLIERVAVNEERQRHLLGGFPNVTWHRSVAEAPVCDAGCFFANEVLDNLPVHLVEKRDGRLLEICVERSGRELTTTLHPPSNPELEAFLVRCGVALPEGHRFEISLAAESLVAHASTRVRRGAWIFIDYGLPAAGLAERPEGSLVCYSERGTDDLPLERPGEKDITVHANWTSIEIAMEKSGQDVVGPIRQGEVLGALGLSELDGDLRAEWERASAAGEGAAAFRALSRRQALGVLSDRNGLGGLQVMVGLRDIRPPRFLTP